MNKLKEKQRCHSIGAITFNYDILLQSLDSYGVKKQSQRDKTFVTKETRYCPKKCVKGLFRYAPQAFEGEKKKNEYI